LKEEPKRPSIIKVKEPVVKEEKSSKYDKSSKSEPKIKPINIILKDKDEKIDKKEKKVNESRSEHQEKSEAKDYTTKFMRLGTILIENLKNHPCSPPFLLPVENIPYYHDIIKYPMDISTAEKKIKSGQYNNKIEELVRDIRQIFQNCYIFNQDESYISKQSKKLETVFEEVTIPKIQQLAKKINFPIQTNLRDVQPHYRRQDLNPTSAAPASTQKDSIKINLTANKTSTKSSTPQPPKIPSIKLDRKHSVRTKTQSSTSIINNTTTNYNTNTSSTENHKNVEKDSAVAIPTINNEQVPTKSVNNYKNEMKMCRKIIGKLLRHYDSSFFREPVDPVLFNIPTYFTIIKNPMDFGTIKKKLENKEYNNKCEFECDVRLVFSNCFLFNPPSTQVNDAGKVVENYFNKEWIEINGDTMIGKDELKLCNKIISKLQKHKSANAFLLPVDRNLYPQYYELIKKPMDISTLKTRLNKGKYDRISKFESDVRLIFRNCYTFNDSSSFLSQQAHILESYFNKEWSFDIMKLKEKQLMRATVNENQNLMIEESDASLRKTKINESVSNDKPIKIRTSMSPEPLEHGKTIIYLKNNNPTINEENNNINGSKSKKSSLYQTEKEYVKEKSHKLKDDEEENKSKIQSENKLKLNSTRSISNTNEVSAKRIKKDNSEHENIKESKNIINNESSSIIADADTFNPNSREYHKCQVITRKMQKHKYGVPFLEPVDPVALNIPTYFTIIKHPMDLSTIDSNLSKKKYTSIIGYYKDVDLMFRNCFRFNLPEEYVYQAGKSLQAFFEKEWANAGLPPIKLPDKKLKHQSREQPTMEVENKKKEETKPIRERDHDNNVQTSNKTLERENSNRHNTHKMNENPEEVKSSPLVNRKHKHENRTSDTKSISSSIRSQLITIVQKMQNHPCSQIFLEPVDPQQFPDYHKFIHNPMDLSTIKKKLEKNKYQTIEDFKSDISLIFSNCNIYNPPGSWAREQGQKLEEYWNSLEKSLNQYKEKSSHEGRNMPMVEVKVCESIIRKMLRNPNSYAFKDPVPTTVPMYHDIIKKPMDFTTLKTNLDNKKYATLEEFHSDLLLIFKNCYTFNMEGSDLFVAAQNLEVAFNELWNRRHDLIRQATEKLAQKGYNVKHLKHRSSTLIVNNADDSNDAINQKSKIKTNDNDGYDNVKQSSQKIGISGLSNSKIKYPSIKKDKISLANYQNLKLKNGSNYTNDGEEDYNRSDSHSRAHREKDRKILKRHNIEENGYEEEDDYYKENKNRKKKVKYNTDDDNTNDDMDIEYSNGYSKKSHDTNRNLISRHSHGHHRHSSSSPYRQDENGSSKRHSTSHLKQSTSAIDNDNDDDNQSNLKIKIKI